MAIYELDDKRPNLPSKGNYWIAPNASVIGNVTLHEKVSVWFNTVIRGDCKPIIIGKKTNIQDSSVLHNDYGFPLLIGEGVTIGHQVMLHGCTIGDNSLVGIGAVILNGAKIGKNCLIGSKALIPEGKVIPDNSMVVGIPGRVIKTIDSDMELFLKASADHYCDNWELFNSKLKLIEGE